MSIPPLVCSTPPPPDQCDDDKEQDEFGLQYNLSQEDDEEFCSFEDFQTSNLQTQTLQKNINENQQKQDSPHLPLPENPENLQNISECVKECGTIISGPKTRIDEDNNIEDLDLKFEPAIKANTTEDVKKIEFTANNTNTEPTVNTHVSSEESDILGSDGDHLNESLSQESLSDTKITNSIKFEEYTQISAEVFESISALSTIDSEVSQDFDNEGFTIENDDNLHPENDELNDYQFLPTEINLENEILADLGFDQTSGSPPSLVTDKTVEASSLQLELSAEQDGPQDISVPICAPQQITINKIDTDDDFKDFNAFNFNTNSIVIKDNFMNSDHDPWKNDDSVDDFGDFQATFDDNAIQNENIIIKEPILVSQSLHCESSMLESKISEEDDNDDDFDDFHSSQSVTTPGTDPFTRESNGFFNFKNIDNESQIYERIEKVISTLYDKHIDENEERYDCNIESLLCETWGHLTESEVRQPYMVNWNNSIGQKALLKALCIDSRNILFGPKWANMPRYAANLGAAPLQPLKQTSIPTTSVPTSLGADNAEAAKSATLRPIETWTDTLGGDGQESCNDTGTPSSATSSRVLDDPQVPGYKEEINKMYASTLTLQHLRQINLPDTHIFTPTDSEEPRSKTIHYDDTPSILQGICESEKDMFPNDKSQMNITSAETENDCDDFQDFQDTRTCAVSVKKTVSTKESPRTEVTYQSQTILEPIKLEHTIATLKWPEPGQVKETFDDFSEFVSSPSWSNFNAPNTHNNITFEAHQNNLKPAGFNVQHKIILPTFASLNSLKDNNICAPPEKLKMQNVSQSAAAPTASPLVSASAHKIPTIDNNDDEFNSFQCVPPESLKSNQEPKVEYKPNNLPVNGLLAPMVPLKPSTAHSVKNTPPSNRPNNGSHDRLNTQQILQPLSLESFSQINWPSPGVDLQDLSRFNPINAVHSLHASQSAGNSKLASPAHSNKSQPAEDDGWGDFVSIKPTASPNHPAKSAVDDTDDWSDFVSSPNGVNTISFNVHTNFASQKPARGSESRVDIPTLNYITPKTSRSVRDSQFQNL